MPAARLPVVSLATAEAPEPEALNVPVPLDVVPSRKVTEPVGPIEPEVGVTGAVKVTEVVRNTGLPFVATDVVGCVLITVKFWQVELPT